MIQTICTEKTPLYCPKKIYDWALKKMIRIPNEFDIYFNMQNPMKDDVSDITASSEHDYNTMSRAAGSVKLHPKERQSLQKMILGMAIEQYGYDPSTRGSAVSQIADDLRTHGVSLDEDTIRKQLKAAAEEFLEQSIAA